MSVQETKHNRIFYKGGLMPLAIMISISLFPRSLYGQDQRPDPEKRPNILFFITDDESWLERSAYGWSNLPTPNFDRVAQNGVLFTKAYTSAPSCAPSRASVLTGRNFWELEEGAFIQAWLPRKFKLMPELLRSKNYLVGRTGKGWGPGVYPDEGHSQASAGEVYDRLVLPDDQRIDRISPLDYIANFKSFLNSREDGQPFFFWFGTTEPHGPFADDNYIRLKQEFGVSPDEVAIPPFMANTKENMKARANFAYEVCYADRVLGQALQVLEQMGELDNTLIIVTSDNGTPVGDKGKATAYDWGTHVPMAVMWPRRVPAGRTVSDFVGFPDIAPTILEASGTEIPPSMSGKSFLPSLVSSQSGRVDTCRDFIVTGLEWHGEFDPVSRSSRTLTTDRFAFIINYDNQRPVEAYTPPGAEVRSTELYDLENDPWQAKNLINNSDYARTAAELKKKLTDYGLRTGDPRFTGRMATFRKTRKFVQDRKRNGYPPAR